MERLILKVFLLFVLSLWIQGSAFAGNLRAMSSGATFLQDPKIGSIELGKPPSVKIDIPPPIKIQKPQPVKIEKLQEIEKDNLWKALLNFLKFKDKARKKLDARVLLAIQKLGLQDSLAATSKNVRVLISQLSQPKNSSFDSLRTIVDELQRQEEENKSRLDEQVPGLAAVSDSDLARLASQLLPLISKKLAEEPDSKDKRAQLRQINLVRNADPKTIYQQKISDSVSRSFTLKLKNKAEVYGFYDAGYAFDAAAFFNSEAAMVYYALEVNEATGNFDQLKGWDRSPVVSKAQKMGTKIYFTVLIANHTRKASLLHHPLAQKACISNILSLLRMRNANGINISYKYLDKSDRKYFTAFIEQVATALRAENKGYQLLLTVPRTNFDGSYELEELNKYTDRFFIDFASNISRSSAPLAPLTGKSNATIDASYNWYTGHGVGNGKLVVILPYRGVKFVSDPLLPLDSFVGYLPYSTIREMQNPVIFNEEQESIYLDTLYNNARNYRIWFDNKLTLSHKYDYILDNKIGGVGIYYINYDDPFQTLNNELLYKFTTVDTTYLKPATPVTLDLSLLEKLQRHLILWNFILQNPCATCFENAKTASEKNAEIGGYVKDLELYRLIKEEKLLDAGKGKTGKDNGVSLIEIFNYINNELNTFLKYISLVFMVLSAGFIVFFVLGLRNYGNDWRYKKVVAAVLVALVFLFVLFGFTYCFTSDLIPIFGTSNLAATNQDCVVDPNCINVPFNTLLFVILMSILLGFLIYRYLITPLISRNDLP